MKSFVEEADVCAVFYDIDIIKQVNNYYPFGMEYGESAETQSKLTYQDYLYGGKEFDRKFEINLYDFGARFYDATRSQWTTPDPLAEKYYSISPYVYCANNPLRFIDPDGKKIEYALGTLQGFKDNFSLTVQYMNEKGSSGLLAELQDSPKTFYLSETSGRINKFNVTEDGKMTIEWNPNLAKITNEGVSLSPATLLNHEADHANQYDENANQFKNDTDPVTGNDDQYGNKEEKRVIEGSEQKTAKKHGEIKDGEVTRTDHGVSGFRAVDDPRKNGEIIVNP